MERKRKILESIKKIREIRNKCECSSRNINGEKNNKCEFRFN